MKERPILFQADMVRAILEGRKTQTRRVMNPQIVSGHYKNYWKGATIGDSPCPYGQPGDRLWVRETFFPMPHLNAKSYFRATDPLVGVKWKPSIFMPRWASRITLEIVSVRVERLQEIAEEDAIKEGVAIKPDAEIAARVAGDTAGRMEYWSLWERINGKGSWDENPWVFVIEFKLTLR